ncbi:MAG: hypothetical protein JSR33_12185, partial [Proteobacteria bacterium]|nr:hypothetical protein [Pseudomonadota bacterium]
FSENQPKALIQGKPKLADGQVVKLELTDHTTHSKFTVTDFFYSGRFYRSAYQSTQLHLLETLKPLGHTNDPITWKSETVASPYKIHVLCRAGDHIKDEKIRAKL